MFDLTLCGECKCFANLKSWFCCNSPQSDSTEEKKKQVIVFAKLPESIDYAFIFTNHDIKNSINFVFNNSGDIITSHSDNIMKLFHTKPHKMVGKNLRDLTHFIPIGIVDMIGIILKSVGTDGTMRGCLIYIDGICHICCGFPVIDPHMRVISVLLIKKEMPEGLANAQEIIGHDLGIETSHVKGKDETK